MKNRVWPVSYEGRRYGMGFDCPGCGQVHVVNVAAHPSLPKDHVWGWNGSQETPTFSPSLLVRSGHHVSTSAVSCKANPDDCKVMCVVCHSFVREGQIQFLGDCTHSLAGTTVELPVVPDGKAWD